jgi:Ca2+-binding EF-hand superfamily protein
MISGISSSSSLMSAIMAKLSQSQQASASTSTSKGLFSKVDTNTDGKVTVDELAALNTSSTDSSKKAAAIVSAADTDGDNALTEEELYSFMSQLTSGGLSGNNNAQLANAREDLMTAADADGSGSLSYDEFASMKPSEVSDSQSQALFKSADTNSDGSLSSDEVSAFEANRPQGGPQGGMAMMGPPPSSSSDDDDDDDSTVSSLLAKLIDSLNSTDNTDSTDSTDSTTASSDTTETDAQKIFNFFDQDGDGAVSDKELDNGVTALKTAMSNYLISVQESRAAA